MIIVDQILDIIYIEKNRSWCSMPKGDPFLCRDGEQIGNAFEHIVFRSFLCEISQKSILLTPDEKFRAFKA